jgi:hypothetical protein
VLCVPPDSKMDVAVLADTMPSALLVIPAGSTQVDVLMVAPELSCGVQSTVYVFTSLGSLGSALINIRCPTQWIGSSVSRSCSVWVFPIRSHGCAASMSAHLQQDQYV